MDPRLVQAVINAWTVEGINPRHHRVAQARLRKEWPTLANAIEALVRDTRTTKTSN